MATGLPGHGIENQSIGFIEAKDRLNPRSLWKAETVDHLDAGL